MKVSDFIELIAVPVTIVLAFALFFLSIGLATKKGRKDTLKALESADFPSHAMVAVASLWALLFQRIFGSRFFSWRRLLAVPVYTALVSLLCFGVWLGSIFFLRNPKHLLVATPPVDFQQGFAQYYLAGGYLASLFIDFIAIELTVWCIRVSIKSGFSSLRFMFAFVGTLLMSCLFFTLAIYFFHVWNVQDLYSLVAPYDDVPVIAYKPLDYINAGLNFFAPQTYMYMTSRGMYGSYFLPEPVLLYAAIVSHLSLVAITFSYVLAAAFERVKLLSIGFVRSLATPRANALSVVTAIFTVLFTLILIIIISCIVLSDLMVRVAG